MRTSMIDGLGNVGYVYNNLGQMTSETRQFNDALPNAQQANNSFKLEYSYTLNGQLKSLKDPYGQQINYGFDKVGRLNNVSGSTAFAGITNYATTPKYNARGILTHLNYGNGTSMSMTFNNRLQVNHFQLNGIDINGNNTQFMKKNYEYYADGNMRYLQDLILPQFDRLNTFDNVGRLKNAKTGAEARGGTVSGYETLELPYRQSYEFNKFSNMTQRNNLHWGIAISPVNGNSFNLNYTYQNNKITNAGFQYDADGRNLQTALPDTTSNTTYDAKGQAVTRNSEGSISHSFDGNGSETKRIEINSGQTTTTYSLKSSVLNGEVITEYSRTVNNQTIKTRYKSYVRAAGTVLAFHIQDLGNQTFQKVNFQHYDPSGMSYRSSFNNGRVVNSQRSKEGSPAEMDALGGNVGISTPYLDDGGITVPDAIYSTLFNGSEMYIDGQKVTCLQDGVLANCNSVKTSLASGSSVIDRATTFGIALTGRIIEVPGVSDTGDFCKDGKCPEGVVNVYAPQSTLAITDEEYSIVSWDNRALVKPPMVVPTEAEGGAGGGVGKGDNKGRKAVSKDISKLNDCISKLFKGSIISDGKDQGYGFDRNSGGFANVLVAGKLIDVSTSIARNSKTLGQDLKDVGVGDGRPNSGATFGGSPTRNYVAGDIAGNGSISDIAVFALFVHELGNALAGQRYLNSLGNKSSEYGQGVKQIGEYEDENLKAGIGDPDAGAALENCVFGGIVGLKSVRVGGTREF